MQRLQKISHRIGLASVIAIAIVMVSPATLPAATSSDAMAPADKQLNQLYWQGHDAIGKSDWAAALKRFTDLEQRLRAAEPASADAAIYWQAYTLAHANRGTEARATVERLHRDYPASRWGKDADALIRLGQSAVVTKEDHEDDSGELAEYAVQGLLNAPPERALPLLKKVLAGKHSIAVKKRALFVLSQIDSDDALASVGEIARTGSDPEMRDEAIRMLGVSGDPKAMDQLTAIYASSSTTEQKKAVIQAWLIADRKDLIVATARGETDREVRRQAIHALGALDASSELKTLFDSSTDVDEQTDLVRALGIAGNVDALGAIAASSKPEAVRVAAIESLGIAGDEGGSAALVKLYPNAKTPELREAVLKGLLIAGDSASMIKLYRGATDPQEKKALLRMITITGNDAALDLIEAELNK